MALARQPVKFTLSRYRERQKTEEELLLMYRQTKDTRYLNDLAQRYMGLFRSLSERYYIDGMDENDLIQICYLGFLQGVKSWRPEKGANLKNFLIHCASRELMTEVSRSKAKKKPPMFRDIGIVVHICDESDRDFMSKIEDIFYRNQLLEGFTSSPEEQLLKKEAQRIVRDLLDDCLTEIERECVRLFYYENKQYSEISSILGINWKSVDNALNRSKRKLAGLSDLKDIF